jgi:hypothetical protein
MLYSSILKISSISILLSALENFTGRVYESVPTTICPTYLESTVFRQVNTLFKCSSILLNYFSQKTKTWKSSSFDRK